MERRSICAYPSGPRPTAVDEACFFLKAEVDGGSCKTFESASYGSHCRSRCACVHARCPDFVRACKLLSECTCIPDNICCVLRPPSFSLRSNANCVVSAGIIRVWPGAGGLELFRLQLRSLLNLAFNAEDIAFWVPVPKQGEPICLPGLESYGVATYCAAIAAALSPAPTGAEQPSAAVATATEAAGAGPDASCGEPLDREPFPSADTNGDNTPASYDDWLDLLCSVADMLEGESHKHQQSDRQDQTQQTAAPSSPVRHLEGAGLMAWISVDVPRARPGPGTPSHRSVALPMTSCPAAPTAYPAPLELKWL